MEVLRYETYKNSQQGCSGKQFCKIRLRQMQVRLYACMQNVGHRYSAEKQSEKINNFRKQRDNIIKCCPFYDLFADYWGEKYLRWLEGREAYDPQI